MSKGRIGAGGPFLVPTRAADASLFPSFGAICIVPFLVGGEVTPAWTKSSPPITPVAGSASFSDARHRDTLAGSAWMRAGQAQVPAVPPSSRILVEPQTFDTPAWTRGNGLQPIAPTTTPIPGRAIPEPQQSYPGTAWTNFSTATPLPPVVTDLGGAMVTDARHKDFYANPPWLWRSFAVPTYIPLNLAFADVEPVPTPPSWILKSQAIPLTPASDPPKGTVFVGAEWPHAAPFSWTSATPKAPPFLVPLNIAIGTPEEVGLGIAYTWLIPTPHGPQIAPPPEDVGGGGGSNAIHPRRVIYEKGTKRKPKTFIEKIGEPFLELEKTPEPVPDAASAGALPENVDAVREALEAQIPEPVPPVVVKPSEDDDDDDLLLLS